MFVIINVINIVIIVINFSQGRLGCCFKAALQPGVGVLIIASRAF
jgi:hypothetical protein